MAGHCSQAVDPANHRTLLHRPELAAGFDREPVSIVAGQSARDLHLPETGIY
jgi:hypothetical protein